MAKYEAQINEFMTKIIAKNPGESEFHQAVKEVVEEVKAETKRKSTRSTSSLRWRFCL